MPVDRAVWALTEVCRDVTLVGHHERKLALAQWNGLKTARSADEAPPGADYVVEATGTGQGLMESIGLVKPRGTLVLKSTVVSQGELTLAAAVVNEITIVGSRCGPFGRALEAMQAFSLPVEGLIEARYPLDQAEAAFRKAGEQGALKVIVDVP